MLWHVLVETTVLKPHPARRSSKRRGTLLATAADRMLPQQTGSFPPHPTALRKNARFIQGVVDRACETACIAQIKTPPRAPGPVRPVSRASGSAGPPSAWSAVSRQSAFYIAAQTGPDGKNPNGSQ